MGPIPPITIPEPVRLFPSEEDEENIEDIDPTPSIPYGWEDTKDFSWR